MNCPEHLLFKTRFMQIWHHQQADVGREHVTWTEVLDPLRYEIAVGPGPGKFWRWNDDAWMRVAVANFWFRIWGHRKYKHR